MRTFLSLIGIMCIAYACYKNKRIDKFKDVLNSELMKSEENDVILPRVESDTEEIKHPAKQKQLLERELEHFKEFEKKVNDRIEAMEISIDELKRHRSLVKSDEACDYKKREETIKEQYDFQEKSIEEIAFETGKQKGELLLLKRLSKK